MSCWRTLLSLYVGEEGQGTRRERFSTRGTPGILNTIGEVATSPEGERVGEPVFLSKAVQPAG